MATIVNDSMTSEELITHLGQKLVAQGMFFATAESCTGGLVAEECTNISGSSAWFVGGVVAYANKVKQGVLGVAEHNLINYGAVSEAVVRDMAEGVCRIMNAQCSVAISGVAGPTGGSPDKPVGTVWIACAVSPENANKTMTKAHCFHFTGSRNDVRHAATKAALIMALEQLDAYTDI
ncbi:MAG: CinA family protein [Pseudomonadota bacterium]